MEWNLDSEGLLRELPKRRDRRSSWLYWNLLCSPLCMLTPSPSLPLPSSPLLLSPTHFFSSRSRMLIPACLWPSRTCCTATPSTPPLAGATGAGTASETTRTTAIRDGMERGGRGGRRGGEEERGRGTRRGEGGEGKERRGQECKFFAFYVFSYLFIVEPTR